MAVTEKTEEIVPEEESTLAEDFTEFLEAFAAFAKIKEKLEKRLGNRKERYEKGARKDIPTRVRELLVRFCEESDFIIEDPDNVLTTWSPDLYLPFKADIRILVGIRGVKKRMGEGERNLEYAEIAFFKEKLAQYLTDKLCALDGQFIITVSGERVV
jgi:hypothetical protein